MIFGKKKKYNTRPSCVILILTEYQYHAYSLPACSYIHTFCNLHEIRSCLSWVRKASIHKE